jgi:predicted nuclease of restriction endonuclease-like (RecB) superfamily
MTSSEFQRLIELFEETHRQLQLQAARSVDIALVVRNWLFGYYIVEFENGGAERSEVYGRKLIENLSASLTELGLKGTSPTNLRKFRAFYEAYPQIRQAVSAASVQALPTTPQEIQQTPSVESLFARFGSPEAIETLAVQLAPCFKLGWSHYVTLLTLKNPDKRRFYEIEAITNFWSVRVLERQINSALYERLALSRDKDEIRRLAEQGLVIEKATDIIKNPYVLEFLNLREEASYSESELESAIIEKIEQFLLELGKGFLFEARQKRFTFDNDHFYVDLVFYNRLLRCYVLIDLKIDKLTHQDLGQMQMYVHSFDRFVKLPDENPTVGIILCQSKNNALVEITLPENESIYASEYQLYLPSKEVLRQKLLDWAEEERES